MTIEQPSEAAMIAAVDWAEAHGTLVTCETAEEMFRHAEAWCHDPELLRAAVGEHHVAGPDTQHNFALAPAAGELMRPDGGGMVMYVIGLGLLCTQPEWLLAMVRSLPEATLAEITEAIATARADPSAAARGALYLHARADMRAVALRVATEGIERPVVLLLDPDDPVGCWLAGPLGAQKAAAAVVATGGKDKALLLRALPMAALMHPESPLATSGREFLTRSASREGHCPVIVVASGGTSYFSLPFTDEERDV